MRFALALCFLLAPPTAHAGDGYSAGGIDRELRRIVNGKGGTDPLAGAALAVMVGDRLVYSGAAGCAEFKSATDDKCARPLRATSKFRVASVSKMAIALALARLIDESVVDLDRAASDYIGWPLSNPDFPDRPITVRHLLSHRSSVRDPEEYWIAAPREFRSLFVGDAPPFAAAADDVDFGPGAWFQYANLNYGILAAVIEGATQRRFDLVMSDRLFRPASLDIGFNWSGVSPKARRDGAALHERTDAGWRPLVDPPEILAGDLPFFLAEEGVDRAAYLGAYQPGDNPTLFSPQGGLRASVVDLAELVRQLRDADFLTQPLWRFDEKTPNGDTEEGFFRAFGLGVQTVDGNAALLPGRSLIGHPGEAYGLYSGAWLLKADPSSGRLHDVAIAFAATGVAPQPAKGAHPTFNAVEERLMRLAFKISDASQPNHRPVGAEPRPFDETAAAMTDVEGALLASKASGRPVLLVLGGNWCHDSRGLAAKFARAPLDAIIDRGFHLVFVDVGNRDRNLDVAKRFGVETLLGTPTVLIVSPDGALLNADSVHDWRMADSRSMSDAIDYFSAFAAD